MDRPCAPAPASRCSASAQAPRCPSAASSAAPACGSRAPLPATASSPCGASPGTDEPETARRCGASAPDPPHPRSGRAGKPRSGPGSAGRIAGAPTAPGGRGRASLCGPACSSSGPPGQKIPLDRELADLGVELRLFLGGALLRLEPNPGIEHPGSVLEQLFLPGVDLVKWTPWVGPRRVVS